MKLAIVSLLVLFPLHLAHAEYQPPQTAIDNTADVQVVRCPAVGEEYNKMVSKLDGLKASIKKDANCDKTVVEKVDSMQQLLYQDRQKFLDLVAKAKVQPLTPEESDTISKYAENVTEKASNLADLITQNNYCFQSDAQQNSLLALSGFVNEASTLVGSVAGPWGVPIALGGKVVAGFLTGMDRIIKSRAGYDFSKHDDWMSYVQNLCAYYNYRDEVKSLIHPEDRLNQLTSVDQKLQFQLEKLGSSCSNCQRIQSFYEDGNTLDLNNEVKNVDSQYVQPLGSLTFNVLRAHTWVTQQITQVNAEANAYWNDVSGKHMLTETQADLEQFLLQKEAPQFLTYQLRETGRLNYQLHELIENQAYALVRDLQNTHPEMLATGTPPVRVMNDGELFKLIVNTDWLSQFQSKSINDDEMMYRLSSLQHQMETQYDATDLSYSVASSFCQFFQKADMYTESIYQVCGGTRSGMKQLGQQLKDLINRPTAVKPAAIQAPTWLRALNTWTDQIQIGGDLFQTRP